MRYGLHLEGYPHEDICDPSNLSVSELFALHKSLLQGTCGFKPLPEADMDALQAIANEQERMGGDP